MQICKIAKKTILLLAFEQKAIAKVRISSKFLPRLSCLNKNFNPAENNSTFFAFD